MLKNGTKMIAQSDRASSPSPLIISQIIVLRLLASQLFPHIFSFHSPPLPLPAINTENIHWFLHSCENRRPAGEVKRERKWHLQEQPRSACPVTRRCTWSTSWRPTTVCTTRPASGATIAREPSRSVLYLHNTSKFEHPMNWRKSN